MLDELNEYVEKLVETQKEQRNAELAALQHQINPHFLYNTLASVNFLVQQGSQEKAVQTIHALISMLQNALSNVSESITVTQELENLKSYVFINHVRYGERIRVNFFVSPDCMDCHLPKLIIQPFIENAFFHAFTRKSGDISISSSPRMPDLCSVRWWITGTEWIPERLICLCRVLRGSASCSPESVSAMCMTGWC